MWLLLLNVFCRVCVKAYFSCDTPHASVYLFEVAIKVTSLNKMNVVDPGFRNDAALESRNAEDVVVVPRASVCESRPIAVMPDEGAPHLGGLRTP